MRPICLLTIVPLLLLAACSTQESAPPEFAVLPYLEALLKNDQDAVFSAVCPQWEADAQRDLDAFSGITGTLRDARCTRTGSEADFTLVTCSGTMQLNYNGELRDRPLEGQTYRVRQVDGAWKMCGYQ